MAMWKQQRAADPTCAQLLLGSSGLPVVQSHGRRFDPSATRPIGKQHERAGSFSVRSGMNRAELTDSSVMGIVGKHTDIHGVPGSFFLSLGKEPSKWQCATYKSHTALLFSDSCWIYQLKHRGSRVHASASIGNEEGVRSFRFPRSWDFPMRYFVHSQASHILKVFLKCVGHGLKLELCCCNSTEEWV